VGKEACLQEHKPVPNSKKKRTRWGFEKVSFVHERVNVKTMPESTASLKLGRLFRGAKVEGGDREEILFGPWIVGGEGACKKRKTSWIGKGGMGKED